MINVIEPFNVSVVVRDSGPADRGKAGDAQVRPSDEGVRRIRGYKSGGSARQVWSFHFRDSSPPMSTPCVNALTI